MPKEWIDVADTAVKIGLGALITGVFTYLGVKTSHSSEKQKFMLEHKTKLLEQISDDVEMYFRSFDSYISKIAGITKHQKNNDKEGNDFSASQKKSINERDQALVEGWAYQKSAISRLRLVKANAAVKALGKFNSLEKELRDRIVFDKEVPTYDEVIDLRKRVGDQKKEVHKALADFYDGIQT